MSQRFSVLLHVLDVIPAPRRRGGALGRGAWRIRSRVRSRAKAAPCSSSAPARASSPISCSSAACASRICTLVGIRCGFHRAAADAISRRARVVDGRGTDRQCRDIRRHAIRRSRQRPAPAQHVPAQDDRDPDRGIRAAPSRRRLLPVHLWPDLPGAPSGAGAGWACAPAVSIACCATCRRRRSIG